MVTTRRHGVVSVTGATSIYHLKELTEKAWWVLFKQQDFGPEEEDQHPTLLAIGKMIFKKCGGLPLATKTLGSILRFKREEKDWFNVQESELWNHGECQKSGILPALRLSYTNLPLHLKHCFAFCSLFPKNHEIRKDKLIYQGTIPATAPPSPPPVPEQTAKHFLPNSTVHIARKPDTTSRTASSWWDIRSGGRRVHLNLPPVAELHRRATTEDAAAGAAVDLDEEDDSSSRQ
ncbi:hypothetical protein M9H77_20602 [Catharanthus roseus]|uniref:Uncharacterized protein n=1 Tax=Catharanthus roseus TaxID=4058 RepID=A0ACC0AL20_CATRO|nr:hypothetical protein M9H77_20602 [Catharanthus roseus]